MKKELRCAWCDYPLGPIDEDGEELVFCDEGCKKSYEEKEEDQLSFKWIGSTHSGKSANLDRWECPVCVKEDLPEKRFNLSPKKRGKVWKCRFCGSKLLLKK
jgi:rubrerythrin